MLPFLLMSHYDAMKIHLRRCGPVEIVFFLLFWKNLRPPLETFLKVVFDVFIA